MTSLVWLAILFPILGALANGWLAIRKPEARSMVSLIGTGSVVLSFLVAIGVFFEIQQVETATRVVLWEWLPVSGEFHIDLALQVDRLSTVMLLVVTGIGSLIHVFSIGYMAEDAGFARFFSYLNLFVACMLVLVLGASLPVSYIGWEGVALCSYLLIGFWYDVDSYADAGKKAFIVNRIGDFGVLLAMFLIWWNLGTLEYDGIAARAPELFSLGGTAVTVAALALFLGCTGKSAQIPLFVWLPDAMAGPTPVSALIHAATMVTAGVFLIVRTGVIFALAPAAMATVAVIGALTAFFAATIGLRQYDIKKVLAYSTVSQLGYMFLGLAMGSWASGIFHLITHAFFKALLFLGAGSVIHVMHHAFHHAHSKADAQDMRNMGGLRKAMPWTWSMMGLATLAIAGIPPFSGFFSKDEILGVTFARGLDDPLFMFCWVLASAASLITAFYMARLMTMTFFGEFRGGEKAAEALTEAPRSMTGPIIALGILSVIGGVLNLPHLVGGNQALEHWLNPVTARATSLLPPLQELSVGTEWGLLGLAAVIGILGLVGGYLLTRSRAIPLPEHAQPETGILAVLYHKYWIDELYSFLVVRPTIWFSDRILSKGVDQFLVDRIGVGGIARLAEGLGWVGARLQNGQVAVYVTVFAGGAILLLRTLVR